MKLYNTHLNFFLIVITALFPSTFINAQYDSIMSDGIYRTFLVHLPAGYSGSNSYPLVLAMHGGLGSAYNIENQSQLSVKADAENFIVVYPEGKKGGLLQVRTWNAGWCCGPSSESNVDDVGFIDALLDTLIIGYSIDTNRIYATGMSNGGFMTYRLACEIGYRFAAIAPVAASMSMADCNPSKIMPIIHFHSYLDENVPQQGGIGSGISDHYNSPLDSVLNAWAAFNGCSVLNDTMSTSNEFTHIRWSGCDCETEIQCYLTEDGGHSWPGGVQTPTGDPTSTYISATDLMWEFFLQYSLNCNDIISIKPTDYNYFEVFPNPTTGEIFLKCTDDYKNHIITIYNSIGQKVLSAENVMTIDLSYLPSGVYYLSAKSGKENRCSRLVKTVF